MDKVVKTVSVVLFTLSISVLIGCGGGSSNNKAPSPIPPTTTTYLVSFNSNGGSYVAPKSAQNGGTISEPPAPTRECYDFDGWYTDNNTFANKIAFPYTVTGNITLYAKWKGARITCINTAVQLNDVRNNLAGHYILMDDISLEGYANWKPIGSYYGGAFTGKIDGNGYKITNLKIDRKSEELIGLFGYVSGGEITNLALENVDITGGSYVGAIAGYVTYGTVMTDCHSTGTINAEGNSGGITGNTWYSTISNCYSAVIINAEESQTGGIAGAVVDSTLTGCYNTGDISAGNSGGIAGTVIDSTLTGCYNTGDISTNNSDSHSGGIAGHVLNSEITSCYNTGDISSTNNSGGIAGSA